MNKHGVVFSYVNYDENNDIHDGGSVEFSIEADCKECAIEEAYEAAYEADGVDEVTDMTIICKDT